MCVSVYSSSAQLQHRRFQTRLVTPITYQVLSTRGLNKSACCHSKTAKAFVLFDRQVQRIMRDRQGSGLLVRHLAANPQDKDLSLQRLCMCLSGVPVAPNVAPAKTQDLSSKITFVTMVRISPVKTMMKIELLLVMVACDCLCRR